MALLSVVVCVCNSAGNIKEVLDKINSLAIDKEMIVVDDGSNDGSDKALRSLQYENFKVIHHSSKRGRRAAIFTGLSHTSGEYIIIQHVNSFFDPLMYIKMLDAIKNSGADITLGAFACGRNGNIIIRLNRAILTGIFNMLFSIKLSDWFPVYKIMRKSSVSLLPLNSGIFNIELEILAKAAGRKMRINEEKL